MSDWLLLKNELSLTLRPIDTWPGKLRNSWQREKGPYSAPLKDTLKTLRTELNAQRATEIILQIAIREKDLRLDGLPRAGAIAEHPGVILSFKTSKGFRRRSFDRFTKWEANLRALALNLEHLRLANLYGVEADDVQYAGWQALPPAPESGSASDRDAAEFVGKWGNYAPELVLKESRIFQTALRNAQAKLHPDVPSTGNAALFMELTEAARLLKQRHCL